MKLPDDLEKAYGGKQVWYRLDVINEVADAMVKLMEAASAPPSLSLIALSIACYKAAERIKAGEVPADKPEKIAALLEDDGAKIEGWARELIESESRFVGDS